MSLDILDYFRIKAHLECRAPATLAPTPPEPYRGKPVSARRRRDYERVCHVAAHRAAIRLIEPWQPLPLPLRQRYEAAQDEAADKALSSSFRDGRLLWRMHIARSEQVPVQETRNGGFRRVPGSQATTIWHFEGRDWTSREMRARLPFVGVMNLARSCPKWLSEPKHVTWHNQRAKELEALAAAPLRWHELLGAWGHAEARARDRELAARVEGDPDQWGPLVLVSGRVLARAPLLTPASSATSGGAA